MKRPRIEAPGVGPGSKCGEGFIKMMPAAGCPVLLQRELAGCKENLLVLWGEEMSLIHFILWYFQSLEYSGYDFLLLVHF